MKEELIEALEKIKEICSNAKIIGRTDKNDIWDIADEALQKAKEQGDNNARLSTEELNSL